MGTTAIQGFPLSLQQRRLFSQQTGQAWRWRCSLHIEGDLDSQALEAALGLAVRRHEILRTRFQLLPGLELPLQVIGEDGLLWHLEATNAGSWRLDLELPALATDETGLEGLLGEIARCYEAVSCGAALAEPSIQYADVAAWMDQLLASDAAGPARRYWAEQDLSPLTALRLPFAAEANGGPFCPAQEAAGLQGEAIRAAAADLGVSMESFLLAAWLTVLARLLDAEEVGLGAVFPGRRDEELTGLPGVLDRCLPLVIRVDRAESFAALARRTEALRRRHDAWQDGFAPAEGPSFRCLFDYRRRLDPVAAGAVRFSWAGAAGWMERFQVALRCVERAKGLRAEIAYDERCVSPADARGLADSFRSLVEEASRRPEWAVADLALLDAGARRRLADLGASVRAFEGPECLHHLVEAAVRRAPDRVALVGDGSLTTYAELWQRAECLAAELRALGVGPEGRVGLFLERSPEMVVGLLGTLAAGGAYVPLDPDLPGERLAWMARDAAPAVVLTTERLRGSLPEIPAPVVCLDRLPAPSGPVPPPHDGGATGDHLAYVLYTSGTSGRPKGVMVSHRAIRNRLLWMLDAFPFEEHDAVLQKTPFGFDASIWEIFVPLLRGARLVLARPGGHRDPAHLVERIAREGVTHLQLVPSQLGALAGEPGLEACASLRRLFCGGEALPRALVERFLAVLPGVEVVNLYGPTEAAIDAAFHPCAEGLEGAVVPLGRPIANAEIWIVDAGLEPLPRGWVGELAIGGAGLARGYAGRPELTAGSFVPHPLAGRPGERLYRTGDRARWNPDGRLEFLGRLDHQIKVRGVRVEPAEVEAALATHPQVSESAVVAREDAPGQMRLVAYLVPRGERAPAAGELRAHLERALPDAMIPSAYVTLEALPLGPHGKLDRAALPAVTDSRPELDSALVLPRTAIEEGLAGIWREVLGLEQVGVRDDFFDLGGHSLLVIQVMARMRDTFAVDIPLQQLFRCSTLEALASAVEDGLRQGLLLEIPPLRPRQESAEIPLSFSQQRLWFLHQLDPHSPAYNLPLSLRFQGELAVGLLERTVAEIVRRHEVLRTVFPSVDGRAAQRILPPQPQRISLVDLTALPRPAREAEGGRLARDDARQPFDLARDPMLRLKLVRQDLDDHLVLINLHHIASDGWSTRVLCREVMTLYEAQRTGRLAPLADLPVQYADYSVWQRQWLQGEPLQRLVRHWRERLAGAPAALDIPTDRPRTAVRAQAGATEPLVLDLGLAEEVRRLGRREGATPFMVLLAAFFLLLHRSSGQGDLLVGTPVANRTRRELEGLIGFFVNTLVLRASLDGGPSGVELIRRVRETAFAAQAHQDLPFETLVEELDPERSLARSPLFQVMFAFEDLPPTALELPGLKISAAAAGSASAKFDLTLAMQVTARGLAGQLEYDRHLFERTTARRLVEHYETLLRALVAAPDRRAAELPLLSEAERHQILLEWAGGSREPEPAVGLHQRFELQADRAPGAVAVEHETAALTYRELDERANRLAHHLIRAGVGPEVLVALLFEPSLEMIVAILGVLKAGGAYVPLDPAHPAERLRFLLQDTGAELLLSVPALAGRLEEGPVRAVLLDEDLAADLPASRPAVAVEPGNAAYVIYTSGSTGRPKGVTVQHGHVDRLLASTREWFSFGPRDVWTLFHSYAFDFSVWEIWGALAFGGRLVVVPRATARSPEDFLALLRRHGVTVLNQTPASFRQLLEAGAGLPEHGLSLRCIVFGGEALDPGSLRPWFERQGEGAVRLINMFGITETTVHVTGRPLSRADAEGGSGSVIGVPIPDLRVYVLDAAGQPVPAGAPGEAWVAGAGVARGYLGRPELTAERFVPDPWSGLPGERAYRTGDLVRFRPGGELEYLGRIDHQVKVRGFRIELGEIEATLARHPAVRTAVVLAREDEPGDRRLVAYLVPVERAAPGVEEIRALLERSLPPYMVPAAFVSLEELPLTPNGKLDRGALPAPGPARPGLGACEPPRTPVEEVLAEIWSEVLGLEQVGVRDDFFGLGGHSLLATQVMARAREAFAVHMPLHQLFQLPTIQALAAAFEEELRHGPALLIPPLRPGARSGPLPLSFGQQRLWFLAQLEPHSPAYNLPTSLRFRGPLDVGLLERTVSEIVRRHEVLRTVFPMAEGRAAQAILPPEPRRIPVVDLTALAQDVREAEGRRLAVREARLPFDLARGPMLRSTLIRQEAEDHLVLINLHHIAADGWSNRVLRQEVMTLYEALRAGDPSPLADLPVQYADYALWQRQWLQGEPLDRLVRYWRERLAGAPTTLEIPTDRPRTAVRTTAGAVESLHLDADLTAAVQALARRLGATSFIVCLAVFATLLHRRSGQGDLLVGTPVANRTRRELEGLIGFFVNTLVLRTSFAGSPSGAGLIRRIRETAFGAQAHQDLPFEKLVEELEPERSLARSPLFQVMLAFENTPSPSLALPGLEISAVEAGSASSKFDLTLSLRTTGTGLAGQLEYDRHLFEPATARRLLEQYETLLRALVAAPEARAAELPLLSAAERHQILRVWAGGTRDPEPAVCLHRRFEAQADRAPGAVALQHEEAALTYRELDERANRLAHRLIRSGVLPEAPVALLLEPSLEMIVAVLGVLKAGGAYVPLDPLLPAERIGLVLEDTGARLLLTTRALAGRLEDGPARALLLDEDLAADLPASRPAVAADPGNAAYVIYTSGSTGRPKGVMVQHGHVDRLLASTQDWFSFGPRDVWTLFHSYAFDFSVWEIWGALAFGGRLVVVPRATTRSPEDFLALLRRQGVTVLNQTPSSFRQLVQAGAGAAELPALRYVVFGGEALDPRTLLPWFERQGEGAARLVNMFGITETTVHVTYRPLTRADAEGAGSAIGVPIPDLRVYVLDAAGQPVPAGAPGEAWVAGGGVARGYLGRPDLTAERFVPEPWSGLPGERAYRTGDLVRFRPDGELEYLGRIDHQVKVRGFRIELGEIEAALRRYPGVRDAAVLAREDEPGDRRLAAYLVMADGAPPAVEEMRAFLERSLPLYMVPAAFVFLEALPLTPNGKLDRGALPAPGTARPGLGQEYAPPRTPVEEVLCQVWSQVLGIERVGIHDSFFVLGGDSILSLRVRALAEERGLRFSLQDLFLRQSIAELARDLTLEDGALDRGRLQPFALVTPEDRLRLPAEVEDAYPLTAVQAGMLYHMSYQPEAKVYHNVYSYHLRAPFDAAAFEGAVRLVVARHPILRTGFDLTSYREPLQLVHRTAVLPVEVEDLRHVPAPDQEKLLDEFVEREKHRGFDLSCPPLVRFALHRRSDDSFNFSLAECHPIFDGWSLHSFLTEVLETYLALLDGRPLASSSPLRLTVADFVALERATVESPEYRDYWSEALRDASVLSLPRWRPDGAAAGGPRIRIESFHMTVPLQEGLRELARRAMVPFKSVLLTAHLRAMGLAGGEEDVVTGMVCNGRPEGVDGDRILGLFFNTVPFRLALEEGSWIDLVRGAFDAERRMLPFRRYPLAQLQKSRGGKPLFEVLFNYIHFYMLRDVLGSGRVRLLGDVRRWEETNLSFSTTFVQEPVADILSLVLRYDSQEHSSAQVRQIRGFYERILHAMAAAPEARHEDALLLSEAERHQLTVEWNDTGAGPASGSCLHELFEAQAERVGEAPAVAFEGEVLSYSGLNARANRLARYLRAQGVGPEARVGLYARRSLDAVVGLLAILKAGGAYVPLDPLSPPERVARVLEDAGVSLVLTQERLAADLPLREMTLFRLDADAARLEEESGENLTIPVPAAAAAYVLFTSGSTGTPKGVVVEHRQIVRYVRSAVERLEIGPGWSFAVISTFSADLGNTVIFPSLCTGGCLHVLSEERGADSAALEEYLDRFPVDVLKIVPSHLSALLAGPRPERLLPRRRLVLGGEALDLGLIRALAALAPSCQVFNHYGPTETTVGVTAWRAEPVPLAATIPLGRPIAGARIHLLDRGLRPASPGAPGELCIAGEGLARGYLGHAQATAERFVPDPFAAEPGARLYRTGDRARFLPDGRTEFLGRLDGQIKIRGFRIELQEIELSLARHGAVREAAVALRHDQAGEKRLVAFCIASGDERPTDVELRGFLRRLLPEYMLPVAFVWLRELPRSQNGKLDRRALPEVGDLAAWRTPYVPPRNELERTIARVWQEVLQLDEVGMDDNFFDLGGHSLFMLRIHSTLRNVLQRDLPMVDLFEHPTIGSLAAHLRQDGDEAPPAEQTLERARARHAAVQRRRQAAERRG